MRRLRTDERGIIIPVTMLLLSVMFVMGLATLAFVDAQQRQSGRERITESSFDLAAGALKNQALLLSRGWPLSGPAGAQPACTSGPDTSPGGGASCPDAATLKLQFTGPDYVGATWSTRVQDNGGAVVHHYRADRAAGQPSYDANGDGKVWVWSQATARGEIRSVVTQVRADEVQIPFPGNVVTAGYFGTTNRGRKVILDTNGSSYSTTPGKTGPLAVRCSDPAPPPNSCLNYQPAKGQVSPEVVEKSYPGTTAIPREDLDTLRALARSKDTYYSTGCPTTLTGSYVFIESHSCSYTGGVHNTFAAPGMVIMGSGTLELNGNAVFYGLLYAANLLNKTDYVISLNGTARIVGAVAVDGPGGVYAGSSSVNIAFDPRISELVYGYANAKPVKGTWRDLPG